MEGEVSKVRENKLMEKIGLGEKIAYGCGDLASNLIMVLTSAYVTFFYTDALGLNAAVIGSIMAFSRFTDGFSDIFMGYVMDKTKSKYGKARPWVLWISIPIAISTVLIFLVPNIGEIGKYVYVTITYNLTVTFFYTMINIPYGALTSLMTRSQDQRMVINIFRMYMAQIGALIINAMTLPLVNAMGGTGHQSSWVTVSVGYGIMAAFLFLICFAKTKERVKNPDGEDVEGKIGFGEALKLLIKNKYWLMSGAIMLCLSFVTTISMVTGTYYMKYLVGDENLAGYISSVAIIPTLVLMPFCTPIIRRFGKRNVALAGSVFGLAGYVLALFMPVSPAWLVFCGIIRGVYNASYAATMFAMIADTIEYGHWKTGKRLVGMLYSSTTFGAKIGSGLTSAIVMAVLGAAGYNGLQAAQPQAALDIIRIAYLYIPIPLMILISILLVAYKLDKIYPQVMKELQEREQNI